MSHTSEKVLQQKNHELLRNSKFLEAIKDGTHFLNQNYNSCNAEFSVSDILIRKYSDSVNKTLKLLSDEDIEIISPESPKNISLNRKEKLYPDIIMKTCSKNLIIFELKIGKATGREAVTELMAYLIEIRNHLPFLNNDEVSLIIIAEEFGTLLAHAALQLISFYEVSIMCLQFIHAPTDQLQFSIYDPVFKFIKNQNRITKKSFTALSICLYPRDGLHNRH